MQKKIEYTPSCWLIQDDDQLESHAKSIKKNFQKITQKTRADHITVKLKKDSDTEATMIRLDTFFGSDEGITSKEKVSRPSTVKYILIHENSIDYILNKLNHSTSYIVTLSAIETIY